MIIDTSEWNCGNCKHKPIIDEYDDVVGPPIILYPGTDQEYEWHDMACPYLCDDSFYNRNPADTDFCSEFEKKEECSNQSCSAS